eukprot:1360350-Amorphochlora_amoeboformis.AAC.1
MVKRGKGEGTDSTVCDIYRRIFRKFSVQLGYLANIRTDSGKKTGWQFCLTSSDFTHSYMTLAGHHTEDFGREGEDIHREEITGKGQAGSPSPPYRPLYSQPTRSIPCGTRDWYNKMLRHILGRNQGIHQNALLSHLPEVLQSRYQTSLGGVDWMLG